MFQAIVILILSSALWMFYVQAISEAILRRRLKQQFYHVVVESNRLQFPFVRKAVEDFGVPLDYERFRIQLKGDLVALNRLLALNAKGVSATERLCVWELTIYFRAVFLILVIAHTLRLSERAAFLRLTKILEYFANVLGEPLDTVRTIRFG